MTDETIDMTGECGRFQPLVTGLPRHRSGGHRTPDEAVAFATAREQVEAMLAEAGFERRGDGWAHAECGRFAEVSCEYGATESVLGVAMYVRVRDDRGTVHLLNRPLADWTILPDGTPKLTDRIGV